KSEPINREPESAPAKTAPLPAAPEKPVAAPSKPVPTPEKPVALLPIPRKNPEADLPERAKPAAVAEKPAPKPAPKKAGEFMLPSPALLDPQKTDIRTESEDEIQARAAHLAETLRSFRIEAQVVGYLQGPVITQYELRLAPGVKVQQIKTREEDISVAMGAPVRIEALLGGRSTIGIEVPNRHRRIVQLCELVGSRHFRECKATIPLLLGKDSAGVPLIMDLTAMPHILVAGATGSGKSVALNSILLSILMTHTPETVRMILIDPKAVEMSFYENVPHLATPVVTDMKKATGILAWAVQKMDERYDLLARVGVRNIAAYNELGEDEIRKRLELDEEDEVEGPESFLPYIVIVVDELADLIMTSSKEVENYITRLTQKSRAVGIHLVLATQRPSTDVITGLIKGNLPTRIAFRVSAQVDSRVIIDENGAEQLLGKGDMLLLAPTHGRLLRSQGAYVSDGEVNRVVEHVRKQQEPQYLNEIQRWEKEQEGGGDPGRDDPLYDDAVQVVLETGRGSTSLLQRRLEIGYTRAARLVDLMAKDGVVGEYKGSQAREILMTPEEWETRKAAREGADGDDEEEDG
ncbi:MAG: DNA translocase FtsK, partial [Planctomycetota bacterium]